MAWCVNQADLSSLSRTHSSRKTSVIVKEWRLIRRNTPSLLLIWVFCGALVAAKPASNQIDELQAENHGLLFVSRAADLNVEQNTVGKKSVNPTMNDGIVESAAGDFDKPDASDRKTKFDMPMDAARNLQAMAEASPSQEKTFVQLAGNNTGKETFFSVEGKEIGAQISQSGENGTARAVQRSIPDEEHNLQHDEELVPISQTGASKPLQGLERPSKESESQEHAPVKTDRVVNITTPDKYNDNDARISARQSSVSAPEFTATAMPSSDSNQSSKSDFTDVAAQLQELESEDSDEYAQQKDLIPEYSLGDPISDWDRERHQWLEDHPDVKAYTDDGRQRLFMLTGTQPLPCPNPVADNLLLRCFKNKVDYCRVHEIGIFYNMGLMQPNMPSFWAKMPVVRATMLSHPEVEWVWWLDADAVITDMEFEIPLEKYKDYNMVVWGWEGLVYEKKSWVSLNAGSFLIRNCQWSMDFLERWASMGPQAPLGEAYRDILSDELSDRPRNPTDDQAALVFLLNAEKEKWGVKVKVELDYFLNGYFVELIDGFEAWEANYREVEKEDEELREMVKQGEVGKERLVKKWGRAREKRVGKWGVHERRPFVTHFTGCQPCSGHKNPLYSKEQCFDGMVRALNYGDDQVLRSFGLRHRDLLLPDLLPFVLP